MINKEKVYVVVSAYNEEKVIGSVITDLQSNGYSRIVIVDDGSQDNTVGVCEDRNVILLKHIVNRGAGAALKTGIDYALTKSVEIIVAFDGDGQHLASEIKCLIESMDKKEAEVVIGSRFLGKKSENMPMRKYVVLFFARIFTFLTTGLAVTDSQSGFRAFSKTAAEKIKMEEDCYAHCSQIIEEIKHLNIKLKEVPVKIRYTDYSIKKGQKLFNGLRIIIRVLVNKLRRFRCF
jgi:polyprenyl-phospho-N-acetylgalactosaminyl synthase